MKNDPIQVAMERLKEQHWHAPPPPLTVEGARRRKRAKVLVLFPWCRSLRAAVALLMLGGMALAAGTVAVIRHMEGPRKVIRFEDVPGPYTPTILVDEEEAERIRESLENGGRFLQLDGSEIETDPAESFDRSEFRILGEPKSSAKTVEERKDG